MNPDPEQAQVAKEGSDSMTVGIHDPCNLILCVVVQCSFDIHLVSQSQKCANLSVYFAGGSVLSAGISDQ